MNGSIVEFVSAAVDSQIQYRCDPGFLPERLLISTCASSMNWSPNPADLTCMEPGKLCTLFIIKLIVGSYKWPVSIALEVCNILTHPFNSIIYGTVARCFVCRVK